MKSKKNKTDKIEIGRGKNKRTFSIEYKTIELPEEENQVRVATLARHIIRAVNEYQTNKIQKKKIKKSELIHK